MKKTHYIVVLLILFSFQSFSQGTDKNGYIITLGNDTLYGIIDYNMILKKKNICRFTDDKGTTDYTPTQLKGFFFDSDKYYTSLVVENAFLQILVIGELSLYKDGMVFYLQKKGNAILRLAYTMKSDTIDGQIYTNEDYIWKGYVNILIYDCIKDPDVVRKISLDEPDLTRLAIQYNICKGTGYTDYLAKNAWTRFELGINSGITRSAININKATGFYNYLPDKYVSYDQSFGMSLILSSPRFMKRLALQSDISFIKSEFFSEVIKNYTSATNFHDTYVRLKTLSFPQSIRYTVVDRNYRLFINLGFIIAKNLNCSTRVESELLQGNNVYNSSGEAFEIRIKHVGYWSGIGIQKPFNKFSAGVSLRLNRLNNYLVGDFRSNITNLSLSLIISTR